MPVDRTAQHGRSLLQESYAAAKLGQFAHNPCSPKSGLMNQPSSHAKAAKNGPPGKSSTEALHVPEKIVPEASRNTASTSSSPLPAQDIAAAPDMDNAESSLQEFLTAVYTYGPLITELSTEVKSMKEGLLHIRQDMQKTRERATALEGKGELH